jgi:uncharacterized protein (DUF427 family)
MARPVRFEQGHKRVRGFHAGEPVFDTTRPVLVWEHDRYPAYFIPRADVLEEALARLDGWEPVDLADEVPELVRFRWDALDAWFEEDEEVFVHPRDPHKRVDILPSSRHVRVELDGVVLAESRRAFVLHETGLQPRWYFPPADVRFELLEETDSLTRCPYKGEARYWSARVGDRVEQDLAWSYAEPLPESSRVAGLIAFYDERVDLWIEGERQ